MRFFRVIKGEVCFGILLRKNGGRKIMNENYASKKDLVKASGIISCFILAAAGFCALCLIPMEYCREMMIISIAVVLLQFSISNMFFDIFKITVKYEKLGKFVDSFLLGFLVLLLVFDVVCLVMKAYGLIKFNAATFCNLCMMLSVAIRIISKAILGKKTEN